MEEEEERRKRSQPTGTAARRRHVRTNDPPDDPDRCIWGLSGGGCLDDASNQRPTARLSNGLTTEMGEIGVIFSPLWIETGRKRAHVPRLAAPVLLCLPPLYPPCRTFRLPLGSVHRLEEPRLGSRDCRSRAARGGFHNRRLFLLFAVELGCVI